MKLLITGANSYVGARLYFDLRNGYEAIGTYHTKPLSDSYLHLDMTQKDEVKTMVEKVKPNVIIHVAACASSRTVNSDPDNAKSVNILGTKDLVEAANTFGAQVYFMSSAVVLGDKTLYGQTKVKGESIVRNTTTGFIILRPHTIFGFSPNTINDRPFNRILKNLDKRVPALYDMSWKFQPTYLHHISLVIRALLEEKITNDVVPIACDVLKSRYDLAHDILTPFNIQVNPVNKHDEKPISELDVSYLGKHSLPTFTYRAMIGAIVEEIKHRDNYVLH